MTRTDRLELLLDRAKRRAKRRKVLAIVAEGLGKPERAAMWLSLYREADNLADAVWAEWREVNTRGLRLVPHDDLGAFVVEREQ